MKLNKKILSLIAISTICIGCDNSNNSSSNSNNNLKEKLAKVEISNAQNNGQVINPENVKHERKKLVRMAHKVGKGEITVKKYWECFNAWKAHAELGNSNKVIQRMITYAKDILKESLDETQNKNNCTD